MTRVAFGLGANLGDRVAALQGAVDLLAPLLRDAVVSAVYETAPVGGPTDQPDYVNAVLVGDTDLEPHALLLAAHDAEQAWHRTREVRWGARTLDVDLLAYGDLELQDSDLELPHPRAHERGFVLVPWADADPRATLAGRGTVRDLALAALEREGADSVRQRRDVVLELTS